MSVGDSFCDGQAQTESAAIPGAGCVSLEESFKNVGQGILRNSDARIPNLKNRPTVLKAEKRCDLATRRRVLYRIIKKDEEHASQGFRIAVNKYVFYIDL